MADKVFRDPLYNYIGIDRDRDAWLLDLLATPEMQRLRRIHQLGVSNFTYPGAEHNRLAHTLGVVHLMQAVLKHLEREHPDQEIQSARQPLLAAAMLHDVGHGPFSHLFEPCLGIDHEVWSVAIILDETTRVNQILRNQGVYLANHAADLISKDNVKHPAWQKALLSSELDVDLTQPAASPPSPWRDPARRKSCPQSGRWRGRAQVALHQGRSAGARVLSTRHGQRCVSQTTARFTATLLLPAPPDGPAVGCALDSDVARAPDCPACHLF
jgi:hypothetical protein